MPKGSCEIRLHGSNGSTDARDKEAGQWREFDGENVGIKRSRDDCTTLHCIESQGAWGLVSSRAPEACSGPAKASEGQDAGDERSYQEGRIPSAF